MLTLRYLLIAAAMLLVACDPGGPVIHEYHIVVNGSTTPEPVQFTGSYACQQDGGLVTVDISGAGTLSTSFQCEQFQHVRIQRVIGVGLVSLTVYKDGEAVFATPPTDSAAPIVYVPHSDPR